MTSTQVESFLALAECLNFTKAAQKLCVSQSTLSMHIASLEKNLGLTLFIRNQRKVSLSPEGEIMLDVLKRTHEETKDAIKRAHELHAGHSGVLRIGQLQGLMTPSNIAVILEKMQQTNGAMKVHTLRMNNNDLINGIDAFKIDVAITSDKVLGFRKDFEGEVISRSQSSIIYAKKYYPDGLELTDLGEQHFVVLAKEVDPTEGWYLKQLSKILDFTINDTIEASSVEAQLLNVKFGIGICLSSHNSRYYGDPELGFLDLPGVFSDCMAITKKNHPDPVIAEFMELVKNQ